ncbi:MAG: hypothetical protein LBR80_17660 [Deltaproteobacteria bacterium]|jgi:hypothetical protein|nr:hypothetical protein [Deltaproteobacteria bacterium]
MRNLIRTAASLAAAALLAVLAPLAAQMPGEARAERPFDYATWTDVYSSDDPELAGLGISFKVPPDFSRVTPDRDAPPQPGEEMAWTRAATAAGRVTGVTFRALFDPENDLSGPRRTIVGVWDEDALSAFWNETLAPMEGYRSHSAFRHRGWPASRTSLSVVRTQADGDQEHEDVEMLMVMHENVMLVMQCYDSSPRPVSGHPRTVSGICTPFFDSLEIEGEAPEGVPLPR